VFPDESFVTRHPSQICKRCLVLSYPQYCRQRAAMKKSSSALAPHCICAAQSQRPSEGPSHSLPLFFIRDLRHTPPSFSAWMSASSGFYLFRVFSRADDLWFLPARSASGSTLAVDESINMRHRSGDYKIHWASIIGAWFTSSCFTHLCFCFAFCCPNFELSPLTFD
jgi:hypothetical protein